MEKLFLRYSWNCTCIRLEDSSISYNGQLPFI